MKEFFSTNGICYKINDFQPNRKSLVFIHGLTGSISAWREYEKKFESDYNILNIDLRGHGKSKKFKSSKDYQIKTFAEDIYQIIVTLKLERCVLISHSFGTLIALELLLSHPQIAESVIFLSTTYDADKTLAAKLTKPFLKFAVAIIERLPFFNRTGRHIDYANYSNVGDWDIKLNIADIHNTSLRTYLLTLQHVYQTDYNSLWQSVSIPALIVHGKNDSVIPAKHALAMAEKISGSKLILIDNANHLFVINNIPETLAVIQGFISKT